MPAQRGSSSFSRPGTRCRQRAVLFSSTTGDFLRPSRHKSARQTRRCRVTLGRLARRPRKRTRKRPMNRRGWRTDWWKRRQGNWKRKRKAESFCRCRCRLSLRSTLGHWKRLCFSYRCDRGMTDEKTNAKITNYI